MSQIILISWKSGALFSLFFVSCIALLEKSNSTFDVLNFIDPLIGTKSGGHAFAGSTMPFGMAKAVADVTSENQGGFSMEEYAVNGFSHMHDSGTGGSPSLGNFPLWPMAGCPNDNINLCPIRERYAAWELQSVVAKAGYFSIQLANNITVEMTTSNKTALYKFHFPTGTNVSDPSSYGPVFSMELADLTGSRKEGQMKIDLKTGRMKGMGVFNPSFGIGTYTSYVCADFKGSEIRDLGVWKNTKAGNASTVKIVPDGVNGNSAPILPGGSWIRFKHSPKTVQPTILSNVLTQANQSTLSNVTTIFVRVGLSFISEDQACQNAENEVSDWDFEEVLAINMNSWRNKLSPIEIDTTGVNQDLQTSFWSGLYRLFISPQDYTGENPLWKSSEPYFDSFYCIWDSYRASHPLLTLIDPQSQTLMIRSLIDTYRHEGYLPDCRLSLCKGFTQGGSNGDTLLVDSWLKRIEDKVDWDTGYEAMIKDAEMEPDNWSVEGRGGLNSWKSLGYIPIDDYDPLGSGAFTRSISRTVEYAYNDYGIGLMANLTNRPMDYTKYMKSSNNWKNIFKVDQTSSLIGDVDAEFTGFLQPRHLNGTWAFQNPAICSPNIERHGCYLNPSGTETYEGSPWLYTFYVPGDMAELIKRVGGAGTFVKRLDFYHNNNISYIGDEQGFLPVFLYHYAGRPGLSSARVHYYIPQYFRPNYDGLPGNDDSGAMGSFVALSMMGIFPNAGQNVYFITPPFFQSISIKNPSTGKIATIKNVNFDPDYKNIYIQNATLNGKMYNKNWIQHDFFLNGGILELNLGDKESEWGTRPEDLPPSLSTNGFIGRSEFES